MAAEPPETGGCLNRVFPGQRHGLSPGHARRGPGNSSSRFSAGGKHCSDYIAAYCTRPLLCLPSAPGPPALQ